MRTPALSTLAALGLLLAHQAAAFMPGSSSLRGALCDR